MKKALFLTTAIIAFSSSSYAQPAYWTNDFIGSIGINVHLDQRHSDPTYFNQVATGLQATGIRLVRTGATLPVDPMLTLGTSVPGLTYNIFASRMDPTLDIPRWQALYNNHLLHSMEGPNEPNNFKFAYNGGTCTSGTAGDWLYCSEFQRDFYSTVKSLLPGTPVYGISETGSNPPKQWYGAAYNVVPSDAVNLTAATWPDTGKPVIGTNYSDFVNNHNYVSGNATTGFNDNFAWTAELTNLNGGTVPHIDGFYNNNISGWWNSPNGFKAYTVAQGPMVPRVTTETSWGTSGPGAITPQQQGMVALDVYLDAFLQAGTVATGPGFGTYWYEMFDNDGSGAPQGFYGPYTATTMPTAKPAVGFISNMITILKDAGAKPTLGSFTYSVSGKPGICENTSTSTVHNILFQKGAQFYIAVWDERNTEAANYGDNVTVTFDGASHFWTLYDPTVGKSPIRTGSGLSTTVHLTDHPVFIAIK